MSTTASPGTTVPKTLRDAAALRLGARRLSIASLLLAMSGCVAPWTISRMHSDLEAIRRQVRPLPNPPGFVALRAAIHVHSEFSHDCDGKIREIAKAARACKVDVVFLTDHTNPALFERGPDGWVDGVYFVRGEEISKSGSLLSLGTSASIPSRGRTMQALIDAVKENDGIAAIGHLETTDLRYATGFSTVSVHNLHADAKRIPYWMFPKIFLDALLYGKDRANELMLHNIVKRSGPELGTWDRLLAKSRVSAIAELDAHQNVDVLGMNLDPYKRILRVLHTYLIVPEHWTRGDLLDAVRTGRSYVGFSVIADPAGFSFDGFGADGTVISAGEEVAFHDGLALRVSAPAPGEIVALKNGKLFAHTRGRTLDFACDSPGVYRSEVRVRLGGKSYPWIISNPIYVGAALETVASRAIATEEVARVPEVVTRALGQ